METRLIFYLVARADWRILENFMESPIAKLVLIVPKEQKSDLKNLIGIFSDREIIFGIFSGFFQEKSSFLGILVILGVMCIFCVILQRKKLFFG